MQGDVPEAWPVTGQTVLGHGRVSDFVDEQITTPSGDSITRQFLKHPGAVAIVAWDEDTDAIACLRQYRHPVKMELVEIPAGLLDAEGEDWIDAARRELAEEVELQAQDWQVLVDMVTSPGASEESLRIYLARDISPAARPAGFVLEGEEAHMTWSWIPRQELIAAIFAGQCQSPTLVAGVLALETARQSGTINSLREATAPWPIRSLR